MTSDPPAIPRYRLELEFKDAPEAMSRATSGSIDLVLAEKPDPNGVYCKFTDHEQDRQALLKERDEWKETAWKFSKGCAEWAVEGQALKAKVEAGDQRIAALEQQIQTLLDTCVPVVELDELRAALGQIARQLIQFDSSAARNYGTRILKLVLAEPSK